MQSPQTAILGAGITGLCAAHSLSESGQRCHVFESGSNIGGALQSTRDGDWLAEHGPNSLLVKDRRISELFDQIGLGTDSIGNEQITALPEAHKRYIVHEGRLVALPSHPFGLLRSPLLSLGGKLRLLLEPLLPRYSGDDEESFGDFIRRRLGKGILHSAAGPFVSGIYAGDPDKLSVRHAFPRLWQVENDHRSLLLGAIAARSANKHSPNSTVIPQMVSFRSGMAALPQAIADHLPDGTLHLKTRVTAIRPLQDGWELSWADASGHTYTAEYARLVIAVPHHRLHELPLPAKILSELAPVTEIEAPPVSSLVLGFRREDIEHQLDGFGMLIKEDENSPLLGVLFSSSMFEGRAPEDHVTLTCMMGGSLHPDRAENSEEVVLGELDRLLGVHGEPVFKHRITWDKAIPQYGLDYQNALEALEACENSHVGLYFAGNYRGGISVPDCILNGLSLGKRLATNNPAE
ncbi:protoporphyrinogen oxidase [Oceaniferula spumae]|uniref:protoporphyrinogen oxidase n=1 Tax=Oceaniferula spumae TaxID=2979115 RepID=UPI003F4E8764